MSSAWRAPARTFVATLAVIVPLAVAMPAWGDVRINEVETEGADFIELYNTGAGAVDIGGYEIKDSNDANSFAVPGGTMIPAGGTYLADNLGFGLSDD